MLLSKLLFIILFLFLLQKVTGIEKENPFSDDKDYSGASGGLFRDNGDYTGEDNSTGNAMNNGSNPDVLTNYSDHSFYHELTTLTSNGVIKITIDVMLLSVIQLVGLENISITGHNSPTVNCDNAGGIHFDNCHNCTVLGITWEKCGTESDRKPVIELYNSSNIIVQNCSFQHSVTQAIALSEMSGKVIISGCNFLFNYFKGHGTAIHYLTNNKHIHSKFQFTVTNCNFTHNGMASDKSIVYIGPSSNKSLEQMYFMNSVFTNNRGVPLYISYQIVVVNGNMFMSNLADRGGAIFITNHAKLVFYKSDTKFVNNTALKRGGALYINNSSATFQGKTVTINNNKAKQGGALYIINSCITFEGNSTVTANDNLANDVGGFICIRKNSNVIFGGNSLVKFSKNAGVFYTGFNSNVTFEGNSTVIINNSLKSFFSTFVIIQNSNVTFKGVCTVTMSNNLAGALLILFNSAVTFGGNSTVRINNNHIDRFSGGAFDVEINSAVLFEENSTVSVNNSLAEGNGGAFYISDNSDVTFKGNSTVTINNNQAKKDGGAFYIETKSNVIFQGNSTVTINSNQADDDGGALYIKKRSNVLFQGSSTVAINSNRANDDGGALYIEDKSDVTFEGNSMAMIYNNQAKGDGGAFYIMVNCNFTFEGNSTVTINNNQANQDGGALSIWETSYVSFEGNSTVTINNNQAKENGGALSIRTSSYVTFEGNSTGKISNNQARANGGALYIEDNSDFMFKQNSTVTIINNQAEDHGGALYIWSNSDIVFTGNSAVTFTNNTATNGGALYSRSNCNVLFQEVSIIKFYNNSASGNGGALHGQNNCTVKVKGNSIVIFSNNEALDDGGALYSISNSHIAFQENSILKFINNRATNSGGALLSRHNSKVVFESNCTITFNHNKASQGGAMFVLSNVAFKGNLTVKFDNNMATFGGALHISNVTFEENIVITFVNNEAVLDGGALYSEFSSITLKQKCTIIFTNNSAENGGAAYISTSTILVSDYSNVTIINNNAVKAGGAIHFNELISAMFMDSSTITVASSDANYGGGIYFKITQNTKHFNFSDISFSNNTARVAGNLLYVAVLQSCTTKCLNDRIVGISNEILQHGAIHMKVATSPSTLKLHYPAKCIDYDSVDCKLYYVNNIMLGQEIIIDACLLDHYHKPAEVTQFKIIGEDHQNYFVHGSEFTSISCNHTTGGISIIGNKTISDLPLNYSVLFNSSIINSEQKVISVNLTVGLSSCHLGFQYHGKSQRCECYNKSGIVHCSGSSSSIKRGYWFGHLTGIPTVTFCPINYCNFTCCKTTNGYYDLSPERVNQCRPKQSGTACGSCVEGHTLSFDSTECININKCFTGQTILVVTLTVLYWFALIVAVFIIKYYRIEIGYLYAFAYYYTLLDTLLKQHTYLSNELYVMVTITSSIAKVIPQFLGQLCLFKNMSGIDQQFIHYVHPLAVLVILLLIKRLPRHFKRFSTFISRGIIHAICFLLLLSYTSVATTSLLLMRSLTFVDVDNVYTYLSPNIRYFHGRHLVYGVITIMFILLVVIGLPLLLLLEPFLKRKVNFYRIQPLLDQFQGCYKAKYHYFAAYYMICRLIIIAIIIANLTEAYISQCLLIIASIMIALIHLIVRPYSNNILNMSDGVILHLMILVAVLPLFEHYDTFDSSLLVAIAIALVILPLLNFVVIKIFTLKFKDIIKNIINYCNKTHKGELNNVIDNSTATNNNFDLIIDDSMRKNATVCEMYVSI